MKTPEGKIKNDIKKFLKQEGAYVFSPVQQGYGMQTLDLLVCWRGQFIALEVKAPNKKLTARQANIVEEISTAGGMAAKVCSVDDVKALLSAHG